MIDVDLLIIYTIVFLYGIVVGSFLNVCIYRIPNNESITFERSHCMSCGYQLAWFDLVPLFSWLALGGKCRKCKEKISIQYPLIEATNGILWLLIFIVNGISLTSVFYCLMTSALLALSVIDFRTYEIPVIFNYFIGVLGIINLFIHHNDWMNYIIGLVAISLPLYILLVASKGRAIGGGDVKLMASCGFLIGWKLIVLAFFLGCILGSVIHLIRMKVSNAEHVLAMGPYLSLGIYIAILFGYQMISAYFSLFF